jgi:hypothetical protein
MNFGLRASCLGAMIGGVLCTAMVACDSTQKCTLIGITPGLVLHFEGADGGALPPATYEIVLNVDGEVYSLACAKPNEDSDFQCEEAEGSGDHRIDHEDEFGTSAFFELRIVSYVGDDTLGPEEVVVEVVSGDAPLVNETFRPTYERNEPSGEGCGFVDHQVVQPVAIDTGA